MVFAFIALMLEEDGYRLSENEDEDEDVWIAFNTSLELLALLKSANYFHYLINTSRKGWERLLAFS